MPTLVSDSGPDGVGAVLRLWPGNGQGRGDSPETGEVAGVALAQLVRRLAADKDALSRVDQAYLRPDGSLKVVAGPFVYIEEPDGRWDARWFEVTGPLVSGRDTPIPTHHKGRDGLIDRATEAFRDLLDKAFDTAGVER